MSASDKQENFHLADRTAWYRIRREMFDHIMAEVQAHGGRESQELKNYRRSYDEDVQRPWRISHRDDLLTAAQRHRVILFGDFHALQQSQKTHLRLLMGLGEVPGFKMVLGLECLQASKQKTLDQFMEGALTEDVFLRRVQWKKSWGFPWEHYRPLLVWARRNSVPVRALNETSPRLRSRDRACAGQVRKILAEFPDRHLVLIYGDLHLQAEALPAEIEKATEQKVFRVFQNVEKASFQLLKKGLDHQVDVIRYNSHTFAVLSVPPWVKWQNYLLWTQSALDQEIEGGDITDAVAVMVKWLAKELNVEVDPGRLTVFTAGEPDLWNRITKDLSNQDRSWLKLFIEDSRSFYLSSGGFGYLARPSVNHASSLAMQFIHDQLCGGTHVEFRMPLDFLRMIWIETVAFFGSKIINPKRKSNTLLDLRLSLASHRSPDGGKEALQLALAQKMGEMSGAGTNLRLATPVKKASWVAAAHLLGALAGERLYHGYRKRLISPSVLQAMLRKPMAHESFPLIYRDLIEIIEALPTPFRSKKEKL